MNHHLEVLQYERRFLKERESLGHNQSLTDDYTVQLCQRFESMPDPNANVSFDAQTAYRAVIQLEHSSETDLARRLVGECCELPLLPYRWLYREPIMDRYRAGPGRLRNGEPVSIQHGFCFVLVDRRSRKSAANLVTTGMFSVFTDGVARVREALTSLSSDLLFFFSGVQPCFRNERPERLQEGWREAAFTQGFVELAGLMPPDVDANIAWLSQLIELAMRAGIPREMIRLRLNNSREILYTLLEEVPQQDREEFGVHVLNALAAARAANDVRKCGVNMQPAAQQLECWKEVLAPARLLALEQLLEMGSYDRDRLAAAAPRAYAAFESLQRLSDQLQDRCGVEVLIDPVSVRAAYDNVTVQLDVVAGDHSFVEVAGGGVFSSAFRLAWETMFDEPSPPDLYIGGFAFGAKRLQTVLEHIQEANR